jgi:predicted phosphodiesterase
VPAPLLRILSDLHLGDERSWLRDPAALAPLLDGVDSLLLNGDTCDTQHDISPVEVAALKQNFAARVPQITFLTGNHDPDISDAHELALADGHVWVTHGDVLFDDIAPWSRQQPELARRLAVLRSNHSATDWQEIGPRLRMMREASRHLPREQPPGSGGRTVRLRRMARDLFPPTRALAMLRAWTAAPGRAGRLAAAQRPAARFVVMGHIHFPAVRRLRDGRVFINTGSFSPPLGALCVDLVGPTLRVRQIIGQRDAFRPGRVIAEFPLA